MKAFTVNSENVAHIERLAKVYSWAELVFGVKPLTATGKEKKKIRSWIEMTAIEGEILPDDIACFVNEKVTDNAFLEFAAECAKYVEENHTVREKSISERVANFDDTTQKAFEALFDADYISSDAVKTDDNKTTIVFTESTNYIGKLVLHTVDGEIPRGFDLFRFGDGNISKEDGCYRLEFTAERYEQEEDGKSFALCFDSVDTVIELYRADQWTDAKKPWEMLADMATSIINKRSVCNECLNKKERSLLPLLDELASLRYWRSQEDVKRHGFAELNKLIVKNGQNGLLKYTKAVTEAKNERKKDKKLNKLLNKLNEAVYEPLWREIFDLIADSQEGYTNKSLCCNQDKLKDIRAKIEDKLHILGYEGAYPSFIKNGSTKGIRLTESYGQIYFRLKKKNALCVIHCIETVFENHITLRFLCGTAYLKENETVKDIYSFAFDAKGRRIFKTLYFSDELLDNAEQYVEIAAKKAEGKKLNKAKMELMGKEGFSIKSFLYLTVFSGGLFTVLMMLFILAFSCIVTTVIAGLNAIPDMLAEMPWLFLSLTCFFGFGITIIIFGLFMHFKNYD